MSPGASVRCLKKGPVSGSPSTAGTARVSRKLSIPGNPPNRAATESGGTTVAWPCANAGRRDEVSRTVAVKTHRAVWFRVSVFKCPLLIFKYPLLLNVDGFEDRSEEFCLHSAYGSRARTGSVAVEDLTDVTQSRLQSRTYLRAESGRADPTKVGCIRPLFVILIVMFRG